jgi:hypothetical protein
LEKGALGLKKILIFKKCAIQRFKQLAKYPKSGKWFQEIETDVKISAGTSHRPSHIGKISQKIIVDVLIFNPFDNHQIFCLK